MSTNLDLVARMLRDAYDGPPIAPLREFLDPDDAEGAYAVQAINTRYWQSQGRKLVGRKIGLTADSVRRQLGVEQPDFGALFADMEIPDGGVLDPARAIHPKAEAEVAFTIGRDLEDPDASLETVIAALDNAMPAIEIVDSRIADWRITFADTVADNGSSAFFVLGTEPLPHRELDLYSCGMVTEVNGAVASVGSGAACLGHPYNSVHLIAGMLAKFGEPLRAGDVVLSGALGPMVTLAPGDHVRIHIGGMGSCAFTYGSKP